MTRSHLMLVASLIALAAGAAAVLIALLELRSVVA